MLLILPRLLMFFALEVLGLIVLFKGVLGYRFRQEPEKLILAVVFLLMKVAVQFFFPNGGKFLLWSEILFPAAGCMFLFNGNKKVLFIVGACVECIYNLESGFVIGIWILQQNGKMTENMPVFSYIAAIVLCIIIFAVLTLLIGKRRNRIRMAAEQLNFLILVPFVLAYPLFLYNASHTGEGNIGIIIQGRNQIKNSIVEWGVIIIFILLCILFTQRKEMKRILLLNEKCIAEQTEQYRQMSNRDEQLRKFRHDYNSHILSLQALSEKDEIEKLRQYIRNLGEIQASSKLISTGNIIGDAILNQYDELCADCRINFLVKGCFPEDFMIPETDLCVILSNAVKNAYEAAARCEEGKRSVSVEISTHGRFLFLSVVNSALEPPVLIDGMPVTSKEDKVNHGLGTKNMRETVERHGGKVTWETDNEGHVITRMNFRLSSEI